MKSRATIWAVLFAAAYVGGTHCLHAGEGVAVEWTFGCASQTDDRIVRSVAIPWKVGAEYGYEVEISSSKPSIVVKEELVLPAPANWTKSGSSEQSPLVSNESSVIQDGRISTQERTLDVSQPVRWRKRYKIIEGDPEGVYIVRLSIDGKLERETEFRIYKYGTPETAWKSAILEGANACVVATMEGDLQTIAKLTYPPLIALLGGGTGDPGYGPHRRTG